MRARNAPRLAALAALTVMSLVGVPAVVTAQAACGAGTKPYTVKAGDTCYRIAEANGITVQDITSANPDITQVCGTLQPGQTICLPTAAPTTTQGPTSTKATSTGTATPTATSGASVLIQLNSTSSLQCSYGTGCSVVENKDKSFLIRVPEGQQPSSQSDLVSTPFNLIMNDACMTYDTGLTTLFPASCAVPYSPRASKRQANLTDVALRQLFLLGPVSGGSNIQLANKPGSCVVVGANGVTGTLGSCSSATATWNTAVSGLDGSPATPTPTATPQPGTGSGGISSGAIAGIVVGVILGLAIIGILVYYFTRKSRSDKDNEAGEVAGDKKPMNISMPYEGSANTPVGLSPMSGVSYNAVPNDPSANPSSLASFASLPAIPTSDLGITAPAALAEPENAVPERLTTLKRGASLAPNSATVASYSVPPAIPTGPLPTVAESPTSPFGSAAPGSPASVGSTAAAPVVLHTGAVVSATKGYIPREADEIEVRPKDSITIEAVYEDGWCKGLNSRTGLRGVIPSACFE